MWFLILGFAVLDQFKPRWMIVGSGFIKQREKSPVYNPLVSGRQTDGNYKRKLNAKERDKKKLKNTLNS